MKSINKSLIVAAVISTALSAVVFAQNPGGQNPGTGATSADPSNETETTNGSGARTQSDMNSSVGGRHGVNTNAEMNTIHNSNDTSVQDRDMYRKDTAGARDLQPGKKRSFWDRVFGRNKHLDADQNRTTTRPSETDPTGRRQDSTSGYQP